MNPLIIYHKDCFDGITAAWVADVYFKGGDRLCEFYPATYGDAPPDVKDKIVFILDFSYPRAILEKMASEAMSITVLDHHKTAEEDLHGLSYALFDMNRSGAGIAWDWFFPGRPRHWLVNCIEDRDLWRFAIPGTKECMAYIATIPMTVYDYNFLSLESRSDVERNGISIKEYIDNYGRKVAEHVVYHAIGGLLFPIMNISYQNCSDHLDAFIEASNGVWDRAASFFLRRNEMWQFSLRSRGDLDVSAIAKLYGGGGHKNDAGFAVERLLWEMP